MHMCSLNKNKRNIITNIISSYGACVYMLLEPWYQYQVWRDLSTCCCQHIDHVDNQLFLHQNGKGVSAPLRSKISLFERCNRKGTIDISLKLHKKVWIYNVEEHSSIYRIANRTIDLLQQRLKLWLLIRLQQYYHMAKVLAKVVWG